jgi:undecaprenyl diphosphate synthase
MHTTMPNPAEPNRGSFHVAVIMDGNGRWAKARGLPRVAGHKRGADAVRATVEAAPGLGITHLTLFGFSSENWRRPEDEVSTLMGLLRLYLRNEVSKLHDAAVRLRFIGDRTRLSGDIAALMAEAEAQTAANPGLQLTVALSYGGRAEIAEAARRLAERVQAGEVAPEDIDEQAFESALQTHGLPDPDLLIRTSGEQRISNFLLWQCAYTEMVFTDVLWPDFTAADLKDCIAAFAGRQRRFGAVSA